MKEERRKKKKKKKKNEDDKFEIFMFGFLDFAKC